MHHPSTRESNPDWRKGFGCNVPPTHQTNSLCEHCSTFCFAYYLAQPMWTCRFSKLTKGEQQQPGGRPHHWLQENVRGFHLWRMCFRENAPNLLQRIYVSKGGLHCRTNPFRRLRTDARGLIRRCTLLHHLQG